MADIRTFNLQLDAFAAKVRLIPGVVVKQVAFDLFGRIIKRTPVDTGRARGSWTMASNKADRRVLPPAAPGGGVYPEPSIGFIEPSSTIVISNNLPYIMTLENGHSQQSPAGMVAVSIAEVRANLAMKMKTIKDLGA